MSTEKMTIKKALILLNLKSNCTKEEIKKAFRKNSLIYHPDKKTGNTTKFIMLKEAYDLLISNIINPLLTHEKVFKYRVPNFIINKVSKYKEGYILNVTILNIKELILGNINGVYIEFNINDLFVLNQKINCNLRITYKELDKVGYNMVFSIRGIDDIFYIKEYKLEKPKFYERWF